MAPTDIRVIIDPPLEGAANMGRDEMLLERVGAGQSPPTLRFYQWDPPTISLGYFQKYADYEQLEPPAGDLNVVRRMTGGGAILHDQELTYSITVPLGHPILGDGATNLYEIAHDALIEVLGEDGVDIGRGGETDGSGAARGPFFCFARRHSLDVLVSGDKLAGSAQRRSKQAVLQHGSIILERRFEQQPAAAITTFNKITPDELAQQMTAALHRVTNQTFTPGQWQDQELTAAQPFTAKYAGKEWTQKT